MSRNIMKKGIAPVAAASFERPMVTVDVVIFSVVGDALKVLLVRRPEAPSDPFPGRWALPGGFVDVKLDASLHDCALRKLKDKTGVATPYLEQLGSWGSATRDPRGWSATHAWFAMIHGPQGAEPAGANGTGQWLAVDEASRKRLAFDHNQILAAALERLRSKVEYTSLPAYLLAEPFTLPQLQQAYEIVLGRPLDKSAFRKRMLDAAFLEEAGMVAGSAGRPAMGYRLVQRDKAATFPRTFKAGE
jgi:8-oxo-dGTP diphosphatase